MPLFLSPVCNDQSIDANGDPNTGGWAETYLAGSSTPAAVYTDDTGGTPHTQPIYFNSLGYPTQGPIWLTGGIAYKFIIKNAAGSTLRTIDDISGINDASVSQSEWVESGFVPTYIGATSFSVPGDQTAILQINRRTRTTNTSGFIYSTISNSVFAAGITTVTLSNDSGTLDAGLSLVAYALLSATDDSLPAISATRFTMSTARGLGRLTAGTGAVEELTATQITANLVDTATDALPGKIEIATDAEVQTGTDTTRAVTPAGLKAAQIQLGTPVTLTTQTAVDFTGIPSWAKRVVVELVGVSTNGTSNPIIQLGDSGGVETSGYLGSASTIGATAASQNYTNGLGLTGAAWLAAAVAHGTIQFQQVVTGTWVGSGVLGRSDTPATITCGTSKSLSGTLDRIRLTTAAGTDQFDAGSVNISWE